MNGRRDMDGLSTASSESAVLAQRSLDLLHRELADAHDLRRRSKRDRNDHSRLVVALGLGHNDGAVVAVPAAPVGVRQEMRSRCQKDLHGTRASDGV